MRIARDMGHDVEEVPVSAAELYDADEVFVTGTGIGAVPVVQVDDREIGGGQPGKVSQALRQAYSDVATGRNPKYDAWLTYV